MLLVLNKMIYILDDYKRVKKQKICKYAGSKISVLFVLFLSGLSTDVLNSNFAAAGAFS